MRTAYLAEIKRKRCIGTEVEAEVEAKIRRLNARKGLAVRPVFVYLGDLDGEADFASPHITHLGNYIFGTERI